MRNKNNAKKFKKQCRRNDLFLKHSDILTGEPRILTDENWLIIEEWTGKKSNTINLSGCIFKIYQKDRPIFYYREFDKAWNQYFWFNLDKPYYKDKFKTQLEALKKVILREKKLKRLV